MQIEVQVLLLWLGFGGGGGIGANEDQLVELQDGTLVLNSRSFSTGSPQMRAQAASQNSGESFSLTAFTSDVPEPFNGCQGSVATNGTIIFLSHPDPQTNHGLAPDLLKLLGANVNLTGRDHMTVWTSNDRGHSYQKHLLVDAGSAGYSSLQLAAGDESGLWVLYEQSDREPDSFGHLTAEALIGELAVLDPDRFVLKLLHI